MEDLTFEEIMQKEQQKLKEKKNQFAAKGKDFEIEANGPGIVPQEIYDSEFRSPDDPDYKPNPYKGGD